MTAPRGPRGGARGAAPPTRSRGGRGRGRGGRGAASAPSNRGKPTATTDAGIRKRPQSDKKRPVQPRLAAALASAATTTRTTTEPNPVTTGEPDTAPPSIQDPPTTTTTCSSSPPAQQDSTPTSPSKVHRIPRPDFMCNADSLFFLHLGSFNTTPDTNTIALNLMDHFLQPSNFIPELWHGLLHAVCFLFASKLTGVETSVEAIARAVEAQAAGLAAYGVKDLGVDVEGVRRGFETVVQRRGEIRELVGGYGDVMEGLVGVGLEVEAAGGVEGGNVDQEKLGGDDASGEEVSVEKVGDEKLGGEKPGASKLGEEVLIDFDIVDEPELELE